MYIIYTYIFKWILAHTKLTTICGHRKSKQFKLILISFKCLKVNCEKLTEQKLKNICKLFKNSA